MLKHLYKDNKYYYFMDEIYNNRLNDFHSSLYRNKYVFEISKICGWHKTRTCDPCNVNAVL